MDFIVGIGIGFAIGAIYGLLLGISKARHLDELDLTHGKPNHKQVKDVWDEV